jgi:hypothetical protein
VVQKANNQDEAGFVCARDNEITRNKVILYDGYFAELPIVEGRWSLFCSEHGTLVADTNKRRAIKRLKDPTEWCGECAAKREHDLHRPMRTVLDERSPDDLDREMCFWAKMARNNPEKCMLFETIYGVSPEAYWDR